nr:hypothetical protein [Rhabdochromatium marinum]
MALPIVGALLPQCIAIALGLQVGKMDDLQEFRQFDQGGGEAPECMRLRLRLRLRLVQEKRQTSDHRRAALDQAKRPGQRQLASLQGLPGLAIAWHVGQQIETDRPIAFTDQRRQGIGRRQIARHPFGYLPRGLDLSLPEAVLQKDSKNGDGQKEQESGNEGGSLWRDVGGGVRDHFAHF